MKEVVLVIWLLEVVSLLGVSCFTCVLGFFKTLSEASRKSENQFNSQLKSA